MILEDNQVLFDRQSSIKLSNNLMIEKYIGITRIFWNFCKKSISSYNIFWNYLGEFHTGKMSSDNYDFKKEKQILPISIR